MRGHNPVRDLTISGDRQSGKTHAMVDLMFEDLIEPASGSQPKLIGWAGYSWNTTKEAFHLARKRFPDLFVHKARNSGVETSIELTNGNRVVFLSYNGTGGRGFAFSSLYIDDFQNMKPEQFEAIWPCLVARGSRIIKAVGPVFE